MPELPEVETVCQGLQQTIAGKRIERVTLFRKDIRIPFPRGFASALEGQKIKQIRRRAKYILVDLANGKTVAAHLGMSGKMLVVPQKSYQKQVHDHVWWEMSGGLRMVFNDPRRFGLMTLVDTETLEQHELFQHLGPEPLSKDFTPAYLAQKLAARTGPIKTVIMDQELVVGVGNIYACEALFRSHIHPQTPAKKAAKKSEVLVRHIRDVLNEAITSGGSTLRDYVRSSGDSGYFQHNFQVYGREKKPCFACKTAIKRIVQAGRSTFFCPECQKKG